MNRFKKDIILLCGILFVAFLLWMIPFLKESVSESRMGEVIVCQEGEEIGRYSLSGERTVRIPYGEDHYNLLSVQSGQASITEADCPDRLCIRQREISRNGESIICLPHRLVIRVSSGKENGTDAVTY